jgi:hypothetical protein
MASADEPHSASLDTPTDPLMGSDNQQFKESRPGDRLALYTAVVRFSQFPNSDPTPDCSLIGLGIGD